MADKKVLFFEKKTSKKFAGSKKVHTFAPAERKNTIKFKCSPFCIFVLKNFGGYKN